jgi:hypothetical protein
MIRPDPGGFIAELEFRNVERHIFGAHLVEASDDAALEDRPEAFNRVRVPPCIQIRTAPKSFHPARYASRTCGLSISSRPAPSSAMVPDSNR